MLKVEFHQLTSNGDRLNNEDCMARLISDNSALCVVADGLGGHQGGELASRFFCQALLKLSRLYLKQMSLAPQATMHAWIDDAIDDMGSSFDNPVLARSAHTTCAILYLDSERVVSAHCGDSRVYRLNPKEMLWRTQDHSLLQMRVDRGEIDEYDMGLHPEQNKLTRSINISKAHAAVVQCHSAPQAGETFVVCSDGFWQNIKRHEWLSLAQGDADRDYLMKLARLAVLRAEGRSDNVTVQWLRVL